MVVNAISSDTIEELALTRFEDIESVTPGLSFQDRGSEGDVTALRGISTSVTTQAPEAVVIYLNEAPIHPALAFSSLYDIGQIEVIRGPQGTLRGQPAPAGSITVASKRPYFDGIGGTIETLVTNEDSSIIRGGINIPVADAIALRIAGVYDEKEGPVKSATTGIEEKDETSSFRASALWEPSENFSLLGTYQYMKREPEEVSAVVGEGQQGWLNPNGPVIKDAGDFRGVQESLGGQEVTADFYSLLAKYSTEFGTVSYIGSYSEIELNTPRNAGDSDSGNAIPGFAVTTPFDVPFSTMSHELRFDGTTGDGFIDFTFGGFLQSSESEKDGQDITINSYSEGAFGDVTPAGPTTNSPIPLSGAETIINITSEPGKGASSESIFASMTFHFETATDVTIGARHLWVEDDTSTILTVRAPDLALLPPDLIPIVLPPEVLANFIPPDIVARVPDERDVDLSEWIYDIKVVQNLSDDLMIYAAFGTGFRGPGNNAYTTLDPAISGVEEEYSDNYELGMKGKFLDGRLRLNMAVYQQDFDGYISRVRDIPNIGIGGAVESTDITFNGDAQVRGFELDAAMSFTDNAYIQAMYSYVDAAYDDANIPCRDTNFDGKPDDGPLPELGDFPAGSLAAFCISDGQLSSVPEHSASVIGEYSVPLNQGEVYLRGFYSWVGDTLDTASNVEYESHGVLNLYLGVRELLPGLDANIFVKNVADEDEVTLQGAPYDPIGGFEPNYAEVQVVPPREIGVNLRYAFGGS